MDKDIENILKNSSKAELIEELQKDLLTYDKVICVLIRDKQGGGYTSTCLTLGVRSYYEAYGILEVAKRDVFPTCVGVNRAKPLEPAQEKRREPKWHSVQNVEHK